MHVVSGSVVGYVVLFTVAGAILVLFATETVWSIRQARRTPDATVEALRKHDRAAGSLGRAVAIGAYVVAMALLTTALATSEPTGRVVTTVPIAFAGTAALATLIVVERRWPTPGGTIRVADLEPRRIGGIVPRPGGVIATVAAAAWLVTVIVAGSWGSAALPTYGPAAAQAWPTWAWSAPAAVGVVVVALLLLVAVWQLLRRPALAGFDRATDAAYRRAGVDRALRVVAATCFFEASFTLGQIGSALMRAGSTYYSAVGVINWSSGALAVAALLSIWLLRSRPPKRRGRGQPAAPDVPPDMSLPSPATNLRAVTP